MPFYEYECSHCNSTFDAMQSIKEAELIDCPQCNQPTLKRILSSANFRLKGDGFYKPTNEPSNDGE